MEYYYTPKEKVDSEKNELIIEDFEYKHLTKVLRKRTGDNVTVTDGERNIYHCKITAVDKSKILCDIISRDFNLYEPVVNVTLYIAPLRNSSRFEFAIEKAVELGAGTIRTIVTEHTVNKNQFSFSKLERINKIITGAMGQSQRCILPDFHNVISFNEMINFEEEHVNKIVMYEFSDDNSDYQYNNTNGNISLLIGPEGGFTENEIESLRNSKWQIKSLGSRKLRAETAAIVSLFDIISKLK